MYKGNRKKRNSFSGPATKSLTPHLELSGHRQKYRFLRLIA